LETLSVTRGLIFICLLAVTPVAMAGQGVDERAEKVLMARLAEVQAATPDGPAPFATDGCSGGLSSGWDLLAKRLPGFRERYGNRPPWEACCVTHDRVYWLGETADGYHRRKVADEHLRGCVSDVGRERSSQVARELGLTPGTVESAFAAAAELMYAAVRVGGAPCTFLPWRWGYGWPSCASAVPQDGPS
jgi:hypothetical protein